MSAASVTVPLSGTQLRAVGALLAGQSLPDIARDCGISPRTLRDWQRQPAFRAALLEGQSQLVQQTCLELAQAAAVAVRTLVEICEDAHQKGSVRVTAAGKILDLVLRSTPPLSSPMLAAQPELAAPAPPTAATHPLQKLSRLLSELPAVAPSPDRPETEAANQPSAAPVGAFSGPCRASDPPLAPANLDPLPVPSRALRSHARGVSSTGSCPALSLLDRTPTEIPRRSSR